MRRGIAGAIVVLVIGTGALALASTSAALPAAGASPLRLTVGTLGEIGSLDPRHGFGEVAQEVWNLQYPTLTSLDPTSLDTAPGIAAAWSPAPGGRGWIYKLQPNLTWSDGRPVTANDVVYSINHGGDWPYTSAGAGESFLSRLTAVALNTHSVQVTPTDVADDLPDLLVHVVPEHVFAKVADLNSDVAALGVSDGTWHVTARTADSVQLDATRASGGPALRQIVFRTYPNADALIAALAHKEVDVASGLPDSDVGKLEALPNVSVDHANDGMQWLLRDRLGNKKVRQAISLAIDRTELVAGVADGVGTPGVVPEIGLGSTWALDDSTVQSLTGALDAQPARARRLLQAAPPIGRKLAISIPSTGRPIGAFIQRALAGVGIATTAVDGDDDSAYSRADLVLTEGFFGANPFYPLSSLDLVVCDHCARATRLPSADFTTLVAIAHQRIERVTSQADIVGLFEPDVLQAFRTDKFIGFLPEPQDRSLVVFGSTVAQYSELSAAPPPPGERSSNTTYAVGAVIVLALCAAAYGLAAWLRRRFAQSKETNEG